MLRGLLLSAPSLLHRQQHHQHQLLRQSLRRNAGILIYTASKNPHFYKIQNTKLQKTHIPIQSFDSPPCNALGIGNLSQMKTRLDSDDVDSIDVVTKNQMEVKTMLDSGYVITTDISTKSNNQYVEFSHNAGIVIDNTQHIVALSDI